MKEHPILFSGPMVRAILDGRKTQTRRACKDQTPIKYWHGADLPQWPGEELYTGWVKDIKNIGIGIPSKCPYGKPGDRLWVRETLEAEMYASRDWSLSYAADKREVEVDIPKDWNPPYNTIQTHREEGDNLPMGGFAWHTAKVPSIFMPRWASRITLEVVSVRVERLQEISEDDCIAEGLKLLQGGIKAEFRDLWDSINAKRGFGWDTNPWVWIVEFRRIDAVN